MKSDYRRQQQRKLRLMFLEDDEAIAREQKQNKLRRMVDLQAAQLMYESLDIVHFTSKRKNLHRYTTIQERYEMFKLLLLPLEDIKGSPYHPEGDMLYHSLQVFELAKNGHGYDLEFLQAALLHDVGKAIDLSHHAEVGADALEGFVSDRTLFLVQYHSDALESKHGSLGHRRWVLIKNSEYFEDLMELRDLDDKGRIPGMDVDTVEQALDYLRQLEENGD